MGNNIDLDLDDFGLGDLSGINIFHKDEKVIKNNKVPSVGETVVEEKDIIYDKSYTCPVCDRPIIAKIVKTGKNKLTTTDTDLRPIYRDVDSTKYDAIVCSICGYGALTKYFVKLSDRQIRDCRENIGYKFTGIKQEGNEIYTYDDAIKRFKLVLLSCVIKKAKNSERAYTCLKLAWLIRGKIESLPEEHKDINDLREQEKKFLKNALEGFEIARSNENFPICDMSESTLEYLLADLHRRIGDNTTALKYLSNVLISRKTPDRLKDKARDLRDLIKLG